MAGGNKTSSRSGLGQRESIGNPLNLTLGRRPVSAASTRRGFKGSALRLGLAPPPGAQRCHDDDDKQDEAAGHGGSGAQGNDKLVLAALLRGPRRRGTDEEGDRWRGR